MVYGIAVRKLAKHFQTPREAREYLGLPEEVRDKDWSLRLSYVNGKGGMPGGVYWLQCSDLRITAVDKPDKIVDARGKAKITRVVAGISRRNFQIEFRGGSEIAHHKIEKTALKLICSIEDRDGMEPEYLFMDGYGQEAILTIRRKR